MTAARHIARTAAAERAGLRRRIRRPEFRLSRLTVGALGVLFLIGVAKGGVEYARRSRVVARSKSAVRTDPGSA
jgi:hypothetical protein